MSVVISSSLTLGDVASGGGVINANNPIIGYENLVTTANISTTTAESAYPATNMANNSTYLKWQGVVSSPEQDEYITLALNTNEDVDYVAIARHNFYTAQIAVSVEVLNEATSPDTWDEVISDSIPSDDGPILFRFTPQGISSIRIRLQPGSAAPFAAVVYAGKLLVLQRRIFVGHTPITYGRSSKITNAKSESGNFLGRILLNRMSSTKVDLGNITQAWYRAFLDPFILDSQENPFFFAWRPSDYPDEVGFAWMTNDPQPVNDLPNGLMSISMEMGGIYQ